MKAIILAAGEGKRMRPLTVSAPKPMLEIAGKAVLEHILEALPGEINEVYIVIGYLGEKIREFFGTEWRGKKINYIQGSPLGSAHSFLAAKPFFKKGERMLVVNGDDLPSCKEIADCLKHESSVLLCKSLVPEQCGVITVSARGTIKEIIEKPKNPMTDMVISGVMVFKADIFDYQPKKHPVNGEYFLTSLIEQYIKDFPVQPVYNGACRQFSSPEDIPEIEKIVRERGREA